MKSEIVVFTGYMENYYIKNRETWTCKFDRTRSPKQERYSVPGIYKFIDDIYCSQGDYSKVKITVEIEKDNNQI